MTSTSVTTEQATNTKSILFVDDDLRLLEAFRRRYCKEFDIHVACGASEAMTILLRDGPFAVVVSDYHMPNVDGITFLGRVRESAPETARILLTGNTDVRVATDAVNRGEVFRFLNKPCKETVLTAALKMALRHFEQKQEEVERAAETQDNFVATVSHELQTPLASIRTSAEILQACPDLDMMTRDDFLNTIVIESDRLSRLVRQLMDTTEIAAGDVELAIAEFDLAQSLETASEKMSDMLERFEIQVEFSGDLEGATFRGDEERLSEVWTDLIGNAAKASPRGSVVHVQLAQSEDDVSIRFIDQGPGVPDEMKDRLFEKYVQRDDILTSKPQGAGLGLAIAKDVIEMHGGTITCGDGPTGGAAFLLRFPKGGAT